MVSIGLTKEGAIDQIGVHKLTQMVDEYLGELEAIDLATGSMAVKQAQLKTFYRVNGIPLEPLRKYNLRVRYRARAPKPEEVQRIIEVAELREKTMILMLATGGFRIGTLMQLRYRHIKDDLEANRVPLHIHIEAEITKGKYADYDTFINEEAIHHLKLYLDARRMGTEKIPSEEIVDDSPLFVSKRVKADELVAYSNLQVDKQLMKRRVSRPLDIRAAECGIVNVLRKAGLRVKNGKLYEIRVHSIRKFFRTQLEALGAPRDYIEYMMGHKLSTYNDIQMKGY